MLELVLESEYMRVRVTNVGCSIMSIETPDRDGQRRNIVAGFSRPEEYLDNPWYFGAVVGRYVNRIGGGRFMLDGKEISLSRNNDGNHLHGGVHGLHSKVWEVLHSDGSSAVFCCTSPDGEEGYPGNLSVQVHYRLEGNRLYIEYKAMTDRRGPVNLSNHSYFNLSGFVGAPDILGHRLRVAAGFYTEKGEGNMPTGRILTVADTPLDLREAGVLGEHIDPCGVDRGLDLNYVLDVGTRTAAELFDPGSGRRLRVETDRPGLQVYTANWWDGSLRGEQGVAYGQYGAVALETQAFPDSPNRPEFPDTILSPGEVYQAQTVFQFDHLDVR